jgi:hypothetical protein
MAWCTADQTIDQAGAGPEDDGLFGCVYAVVPWRVFPACPLNLSANYFFSLWYVLLPDKKPGMMPGCRNL